MPRCDRDRLVDLLVGLGRLAVERPDVDERRRESAHRRPRRADRWQSTHSSSSGDGASHRPATRPRPTAEQFDALFSPRGVLVTGASTHPGKFGFVSLHNLLAGGYTGRVFGTNLQGEEVLGVRTVADIADLPDGAVDLVFVCTPAAANPEILRSCAAKGVRAAFLTSAGYGEAGEAGRVAEHELVALADELGILLAGPNGQGVVSTPARLCAQIVAPVSAGRSDRGGEPERELRVELHEPGPRHRRRHQPCRVGRQRGGRLGRRLPRLLRRRSRDLGRARPTSRASPTATSLMSRARRRRQPQAAGRAEGWCHRGWCAGGGQPHRRVGGRRQDLRRRLPGGRASRGRRRSRRRSRRRRRSPPNRCRSDRTSSC